MALETSKGMRTEDYPPLHCPQCGLHNLPTAAYCARCGAALEWTEPSVLRLMRRQIEDLIIQLTDPLFAYLKTAWLVLVHPKRLAHALADRTPPADTLPFPLRGLWNT